MKTMDYFEKLAALSEELPVENDPTAVPSEEAGLGIETLLMGYVGPTAQAYDYSAPCSGA